MKYPSLEKLDMLKYNFYEYARLKCEQGASDEIDQIFNDVCKCIEEATNKVINTPNDPDLEMKEPDDYDAILAQRPEGVRKLLNAPLADDVLYSKMMGAVVGRITACLLGVPVEGFTVENMQKLSACIGDQFPPVDYWSVVDAPYVKNVYQRYRNTYARDKMTFAPVDDDIIYTQLALLIMEECGVDFTTEDVGNCWIKYLPFACTAEEVAIENLKKGLPIDKIADVDNPYAQWIGAAIRSDGFAYAAAGCPEIAARMAYRDAYLSHRRNGIYGEMFLAAAQAAAFAVEDPMEAIRIGMTEIPKECNLYKDLEWALSVCDKVENYLDARKLVDERFKGMHIVHTNNNMCLIVFGIHLAKGDFIHAISEIVAMGLDNDCTAASAGSILGACYGFDSIPEYLYNRFNNKIDTYLLNQDMFTFDDMAKRFINLNKKILA